MMVEALRDPPRWRVDEKGGDAAACILRPAIREVVAKPHRLARSLRLMHVMRIASCSRRRRF